MKDDVKNYYGKVLQQSGDLKTDACATAGDIPRYIKDILVQINDEVMTRYYGCGLIAPQALEGCKVLDLGCGSGRDAYVLASLVGESGSVTGVDMTREQMEVALRYIDYHKEQFGYRKANTEFKLGYIEKLDELGLAPGSFDIIVSNCVINLSTDKEAVLTQAYELLKPGGELYFSDVYSSRRVPQELVNDPLLYGECLSGALYWNDFHNLAKKTGFLDPRLVDDRPLLIENEEIEEKIGHIDFYSATYRLFKLPTLEPACEEYGQAVIYKGGIMHSEQAFTLDNHHVIEKGKIFPVCGNTWRMLKETRFADYFQFIGSFDTHYGIYQDCGTPLPYTSEVNDKTLAGCC